MTNEKLETLNTQALIGHTDKRGRAWHWRQGLQGEESNHYPGAIPPEDIQRRLFNWTPIEGTIESTYITDEGVVRITDPTRKTVIHPQTQRILAIFMVESKIHEYNQWLVRNMEILTDSGELEISSAGLLKEGAVAFVQAEMPENVDTPEGVSFRPFISAATSLDKSLATTYQRGAQVIVCDNTLAASLRERDALRIKIKHTSGSLDRIQEVRDALQLVRQAADSFAAEVAALCATTVTDKQWAAFLQASFPVPEAVMVSAKVKNKAAITRATNRHDQMTGLWNNDNRVSPWRGTAFGVVQAMNTFTHHLAAVRDTQDMGDRQQVRVERNMLYTVSGTWDKIDQGTYDTLAKVLSAA